MVQDNKTKTLTDFGDEIVFEEEKTQRVKALFTRVASKYDLMNDLMSFGTHHLWKKFTIHIAAVQSHHHVLDLACGTADIAYHIYPKISGSGHLVLCDLNADMLSLGRDRMVEHGLLERLSYVQANAESLPFSDLYFDRIIMAFGLRNVTNKQIALNNMYRKLRYGGELFILDFSKVNHHFLEWLYDQYSFKLIPMMGSIIAHDKDAYRYLVESIRKHPDQYRLSNMMNTAGFEEVQFYNLFDGIVALHRGIKI